MNLIKYRSCNMITAKFGISHDVEICLYVIPTWSGS